jgi:hypothetical protein
MDSEESLSHALMVERLANVARDAGAKPEAALDVARRVVKDHSGELLTGGIIRLASGTSVHDAIESTRAIVPDYFRPVVAPVPSEPKKPTTAAARRRRASDRLAEANGDRKPRLYGDGE